MSFEISIGSKYFTPLYKSFSTNPFNSIPSPKTPIFIPSTLKT